MDAVFALQRSGSDAVFAYQFPVAAVQEATFGGAWPGMQPTRAQIRREVRRELEQELAEAAEAARAAEVAEATIARAKEPPPQALAAIVSPTLQALQVSIVQPVIVAQPMPVQPAEPVTPAVTPAALDEDAILSASMLLMRRRLTR